MGSQSLGDILGQHELEGESETRSQPLEGEAELNAGSAESGEEPSEEPKSKAPQESEAKADDKSGTDEDGASPAPEKQTKDVDDDEDAADPHPVPRRVLLEERRKRREEREQRLELERQLAELKGQVSVYSKQGTQSQKEQDQAKPTWEDEYFRDPAGATERAIQAAVSRAQETSTETAAQLRMDFSEGIMRSQNLDDFDEVLGEAIDLAKESPEFAEKIRKHPHPAKFAYEYAKTQRQIAEVGSLDDLKAKMREEVRAELEKEQREKSVEQDAARVSTSSAGARSAGTSPMAKVLEDIPIGDILAG